MEPRAKRTIAGLFSLLLAGLLFSSNALVQAASADLDPTFNPGTGVDNPAHAAFVAAVAVQPDGRIIVAGIFSTYNGVSRNNIARLFPDGSLDSSFDPGLGSNGSLRAIALQPDGKIVIGGYFTQYNGTSRNNIARLNPDGSLDTSFDPGAGADQVVFTIIVQSDGKILIGGYLTQYDGVGRHNVARLNANGSLDVSFDPGSSGGTFVSDLALQPDGKVIVVGSFGGFHSVSCNNLARLNADGSVDTTFNSSVGRDGGNLFGLVLQPDGKIIIAGGFFSYEGSVRNRIARLNPNGSLDSAFDPGSGVEGNAFKLLVQPDGKIVIVGAFYRYNGTLRDNIARINANGSLDTSFNPGTGANSYVLAAAPQPDGKLIIGGTFVRYNGTSRNGIARLLLSPGSLSFSTSGYSVSEGAGHVDVIVSRTDTSEAANVSYATSDTLGIDKSCREALGVASTRCDYAASNGTIRFAVGERSKTISIPVVDDRYVEGSEAFTITLSNPVGVFLESPVAATITVTDNDSGAAMNPITDDSFFIRQLYIDFLGREPEPAGLAAWLQIIAGNAPQCNAPMDCDRIAVASGFVRSPEFGDRGYFVYRIYSAVLGRVPHYNEMIPDMARVSGFLTDADLEANKQAFVAEFITRREFRTKFDGLSNSAFVDVMLRTAGLPNHPSRTLWVNGLNNGTLTRVHLIRQFVESSEVHQKFLNEAFIVMNYFGFLRRDPDAAYQDWIDIFNHSNDYRMIINGFVNSSEYRQRFGP